MTSSPESRRHRNANQRTIRTRLDLLVSGAVPFGRNSQPHQFDETFMDAALFWQTVIEAVVQGITEFLPISSDGHLVIVGHLLERWFDKTSTGAETLQLVIGLHLGTLLAVIVVYWRELWSLRRRGKLLAAIVVGTIPAGVIGVLFKDWFEQTMTSPLFAGLGLFVTAVFLLAGQRLELNLLELDDIPLPHAFAIGCFQALAILPGISRSGSTIAGALMIGS